MECVGVASALLRIKEACMSQVVLDAAGRRRSPATMPRRAGSTSCVQASALTVRWLASCVREKCWTLAVIDGPEPIVRHGEMPTKAGLRTSLKSLDCSPPAGRSRRRSSSCTGIRAGTSCSPIRLFPRSSTSRRIGVHRAGGQPSWRSTPSPRATPNSRSHSRREPPDAVHALLPRRS